MNHQDKVKYLKIALNLQGIGINLEMSDRVITTFDKVMELGDKFTIKDAVNIQFYLDKEYAKKKIKAKKKKK